MKKVLDYALTGGAFALAFIYSLRRMADTDLWWHLKYGEYFFETGRMLKTYYFNFSWPDLPYLNHEWLFQAIIYRIYEFSGEGGLMALQSILIMTVFYMLYEILRLYSKNHALIASVLILGIIASSHRFALRPQHFSYVFLLYTLLSLHMLRRGRWLYALFMPPVMVVWVNMHAESLWGVMVPAVFLSSEYFFSYRKKKVDGRYIMRFAAIFAATVAASLINPLTYKTVLLPLLIMKEQFAGVEEYLSPTAARYVFFWIYFALFIASCIFNLRKLDMTWFMLSAVYAAVAWAANRGIPHFVFVSAPLIVMNFEEFLKPRRLKAMASYGFRVFMVALTAYFMVSILRNPVFLSRFDNIPYPDGALRFLKANNLKGNVFNHHGWGGYIIWTSYSELKPYIDGRFFRKRFYDEYFPILRGKEGWELVLRRYNVDIALLDYSGDRGENLRDMLFGSPQWKLVYWDDSSLLYLRDIGRHRGVIAKYSAGIFNPDTLRFDPASAGLDAGRLSAAIDEINRNMENSGPIWKGFFYLGNFYSMLGRAEEAKDAYFKALKFPVAPEMTIKKNLALLGHKAD